MMSAVKLLLQLRRSDCDAWAHEASRAFQARVIHLENNVHLFAFIILRAALQQAKRLKLKRLRDLSQFVEYSDLEEADLPSSSPASKPSSNPSHSHP